MTKTITPVNKVGPYRTGTLENISYDEIVEVIGEPNCVDDPDKVRYSWGFKVDGKYAAIWDYRGSHYYNSWSTFDPEDVLPTLFPHLFGETHV